MTFSGWMKNQASNVCCLQVPRLKYKVKRNMEKDIILQTLLIRKLEWLYQCERKQISELRILPRI